ncbi:MAG: TetR/AcrR family transcriptional regulator [Holophagales bacterium]|nr:TetR/AcrR family transcriptional regulator [Holophagales bacterium]
MKGQLPVPREPTATERRLLEAALEVFAEKGLHGATTQEIGDAAGVGKSTLHYYFRHKDELYARVFEDAFVEMAEPLGERLEPGQGLRETLEAFVGYQVRAYFARPAMVRLWMHENMIGAPFAVPLLRRFNALAESPYRTFVDNLRAAVERGESRPVDPFQTFVTVMGACLFLPIAQASMAATLESLGREPLDLEGFVAERTEHLVDLLHRGLGPAGSGLRTSVPG